MKFERYTLCAVLLVAATAALRVAGFTRGTSDFVLPEDQQQGQAFAFYTFHPDEDLLVNAALRSFDLLHPPFTSYGTLPAFALGAALRAAGARDGRDSLSGAPPAIRQRAFYVARALAIGFSCGVVLLTWWVGRHLGGGWAGLGAAALVAFAPGAIQQAHFYIVDGLFALTSLAALAVILRRRPQQGQSGWALAGLLIGATTCVRLNGGLLGVVLLAGSIAAGTGGARRRLVAALRQRGLWLAAGAAVALFLLFHPFLVVDPELLTRARRVGDFGLALKFASGEYLQPWTLVDVHVTPFVDHWFGMWPLAAGWPLTLAFLLALGWAAWRGGRDERLLALWCLLYFAPVGLLSTRAVRHLVPLLAPLAVLTAQAARDLARALPAGRPRQVAAVAAVLAGGHLFVYGTAFARIYQVEDSRIRAGRYLASQVRPGTLIGVESGAFSMSAQVSASRHRRLWMDTSRLFYSGPYLLCSDQAAYLEDKVARMGAMTDTDVNRAAQYTSVPELFPALASFYRELAAGHLGLQLVRRFKTYPELAGITFRDDGVDPSFLGYDHPAVLVFLRPDTADVAAAFARWRQQLEADPWCPDTALRAAAARLRAGDGAGAGHLLDSLAANNPNALLTHRLRAEAWRLQGDEAAVRQAMERFRPETAAGRMAHSFNPRMVHFATPSAALSLVSLGLFGPAVDDLRQGLSQDYGDDVRAAQSRATAYLQVAEALGASSRFAEREAVARMSLEIYRTTSGCNTLAHILQSRGELEEARRIMDQSLLLDANQGLVHLAVAELHLQTTADVERAVYHLERAAALQPDLAERALRLRDRARATRTAGPP